MRELVLQAYAQIPGFGEDPGSPPEVARAGDTRLRLVPRGRNYATADGRGPSNEALLACWPLYPRRHPTSASGAEGFTRDVWGFYRWPKQEGLLTDSHVAGLPYRLRRHVGELTDKGRR